MKRLSVITLIYVLSTIISAGYAQKDASVLMIHASGIKYILNDNTILLDRENIYGYAEAFKDAKEAFDAVNKIGEKATLLVAPSVYWLDDPDDPEVKSDKGGIPYAIKVACDTLTIIGLSENPDDVVFAVNRGQTQGALGNFTMFHFKGNVLETKNITFGNYCNIDLNYPRNPEYNRPRRKDAIVQAQIGICENTDRLFADNCRFLSRLNLCPFVGARRSLYDNCYFECTDDALSGSAVYLDCRFTFFSNKPFYSTAETGAVFLNCDISCRGNGVQYFTKLPGQVTAIDTRFSCTNPIDIRWTRDESDIVCRQFNCTLNGKPLNIDASRPQLGPSLENSSLKNAYFIDYKGKRFYNLPNLLNGTDGWDPKGMNDLIAGIESETGKKFTGIPVSLRLKTTKKILKSVGDTAVITSTPLLWGGYQTTATEDITYVSENNKPEEKTAIIRVATPDGLTGNQTLTILPHLKSAPVVKKNPKIYYDKAMGNLMVKYTLSGKGKDDSEIMWGRIVEEGGTKRVILLKHNNASDGHGYTPKAGDLGCEIIAVVFPKYKDTKTGLFKATQPFAISTTEVVAELPESSLMTDFSDVPIEKRDMLLPGVWNFDVYKPADTADADWEATDGAGWRYGKGYDASVSKGIFQSERGARMSYVPARDVCHDMTAELTVEPAKSGGQGFGSATHQYMDICVKFDPVTLTGYALRIERTPDHDRAVSFSLIRYDNGNISVISDAVVSNCYRTPCHIKVGVTDGILSAIATTEAGESKKCCEDIKDSVDLSVPISENLLTGFCIQHTGSTGPSSTLIKNLKLNWR